METELDMAYPYVVMRLRGELHLLETNLQASQADLPGFKTQVRDAEEQIKFLQERIIELHQALASLEE